MGKVKSGKKKGRLPVRIVMVVLAVICIGVGMWHYASGNRETEEEPVNKEAYYDGWGDGVPLPLDGKQLTARAGRDGNISLQYGKSSGRGLEYLSLSGEGTVFSLYRIQSWYYLKDDSGWHKAENIDKSRYDMLWDAAVHIQKLPMQGGRYEKTEGNLDAILCSVPDTNAMKKEEEEQEAASAVVDDGYGNDVPVVIFDPGMEEEKDQKYMDIRIWLDENGGIKKLEWPAGGTEYLVEQMDDELPDGATNAKEEDVDSFADRMEDGYMSVVAD